MSFTNPIQRLLQVISEDRRLIIGVISGTSADGVDVVVVDLENHGRSIKWRFISKGVVPYPLEMKKRILLSSEVGSVEDVCILNYAVGRFFARAIATVLEDSGINPSEVDAIGSHGQTVYHMSEYVSIENIVTRCTLQLGNLSVIAEDTGVITVGDFRSRDIAAGGQGAPIIAYVDWALLTSNNTGRLIQNIGGIANVTVLPPNADLSEVYAFDTGPGNMVIDEVMRILYGVEFDLNGSEAMDGNVSPKLLNELMAHDFIYSPPPKTAGRREFGRRFTEYAIKKGLSLGLSKKDIVATISMFTVKSIVYNYDKYVLKNSEKKFSEVVLGGGGTRNRFIVRELEKELKKRGLKLLSHEELGIDSKYKEALGMAVLAHETLSGISNNVPKATGALKQVVMGLIAM
ncbi:MAG: anhydro-N-acetylmuramic acid kinase [Sulfolobales archaeon]|nr:anhydro-N-acetylmuramic acid kinase [Sulfolobales archaeon]MDW8083425.1 anhydro-N-acetylmuramic acid kinase [Sulfolobales archaeon]